jgi:hypothetical protein
MPKGIGWAVAAAALVYLLLLRPRAKAGTVSPKPSPAGSGAELGEAIGRVADGVAMMFRSTPSSTPVTEQGDIALFPG